MTNLTGTNTNLTTQVATYANHLATKDSDTATMERTIRQIKWEIKNPNINLAGQTTKIPGAKQA